MKKGKPLMRIPLVLCTLFLALGLIACSSEEKPSIKPSPKSSQSKDTSKKSASKDEASNKDADNDGLIQITTQEGNIIVFQLNDSTAAENFYSQLPLTITVENYGNNEKIFYPPQKLDVSNAELAEGPAGTLTYYEPWGNVAIFYGECTGANGLYELGEIVSGAAYISKMTGEINIDIVDRVSSMKPTETESIPVPAVSQNVEPMQPSEDERVEKMQVTVGNKTFTATLAENTATQSFVELMKSAPVVIPMSDYSGFEKVGSLGSYLPASNSNTTTQSGDIVLYNGNQIVMFYGSNTWSYTRLGRIDDLDGWQEALGSGNVTVTFSI